MPKSSVSDFELFALKVEEHIASRVKKSKEESSEYRLQKEEENIQEAENWLKQKRTEWKLELAAREQQEKRTIAETVSRQWSLFRKEAEREVKEALKRRLEEEFPILAKCFITLVSKQYETGIFRMPETYSESIDRERFDLELCREEKIVFELGNLYIEYSVERIMEELKSEIVDLKEDTWQV
ncbi:MAG: hypothetical protein U9R26_07275 [Campylobacterota bacterium]|nr:hypothetical protein [Campylobacterota bacterium]